MFLDEQAVDGGVVHERVLPDSLHLLRGGDPSQRLQVVEADLSDAVGKAFLLSCWDEVHLVARQLWKRHHQWHVLFQPPRFEYRMVKGGPAFQRRHELEAGGGTRVDKRRRSGG